eukprot:Rmarinus@m.13018
MMSVLIDPKAKEPSQVQGVETPQATGGSTDSNPVAESEVDALKLEIESLKRQHIEKLQTMKEEFTSELKQVKHLHEVQTREIDTYRREAYSLREKLQMTSNERLAMEEELLNAKKQISTLASMAAPPPDAAEIAALARNAVAAMSPRRPPPPSPPAAPVTLQAPPSLSSTSDDADGSNKIPLASAKPSSGLPEVRGKDMKPPASPKTPSTTRRKKSPRSSSKKKEMVELENARLSAWGGGGTGTSGDDSGDGSSGYDGGSRKHKNGRRSSLKNSRASTPSEGFNEKSRRNSISREGTKPKSRGSPSSSHSVSSPAWITNEIRALQQSLHEAKTKASKWETTSEQHRAEWERSCREARNAAVLLDRMKLEVKSLQEQVSDSSGRANSLQVRVSVLEADNSALKEEIARLNRLNQSRFAPRSSFADHVAAKRRKQVLSAMRDAMQLESRSAADLAPLRTSSSGPPVETMQSPHRTQYSEKLHFGSGEPPAGILSHKDSPHRSNPHSHPNARALNRRASVGSIPDDVSPVSVHPNTTSPQTRHVSALQNHSQNHQPHQQHHAPQQQHQQPHQQQQYQHHAPQQQSNSQRTKPGSQHHHQHAALKHRDQQHSLLSRPHTQQPSQQPPHSGSHPQHQQHTLPHTSHGRSNRGHGHGSGSGNANGNGNGSEIASGGQVQPTGRAFGAGFAYQGKK